MEVGLIDVQDLLTSIEVEGGDTEPTTCLDTQILSLRAVSTEVVSVFGSGGLEFRGYQAGEDSRNCCRVSVLNPFPVALFAPPCDLVGSEAGSSKGRLAVLGVAWS